jgi:hypothetical protein
MGSGGIAPPFLTSALDRDEWSASYAGHFTPGKTAPGKHCIRGWVDPRAGPDDVEKRNIHAGNRTPTVQHVPRHYTD